MPPKQASENPISKTAMVFNFVSFKETIPEVLKKLALDSAIKNASQILIKPNLTTNLPPPVTTPVELTEEVVKFCQKHSSAEIVIAEGSGGCETLQSFNNLGYEALVQKYKVSLVDLNKAKRVLKTNPNARVLKKVYLPEIAFESFIINLPVLKAHSAAKMTAAMKNAFGFYLNKEWFVSKIFGGAWWNKSELHILGVNSAILDLNDYIKFNFNLVDASIGQLKHEIHGVPVNPPLKKIVAGYDAKEVDRACAHLLGLDEAEVKYLFL